mgnify:CR=1 FL=1
MKDHKNIERLSNPEISDFIFDGKIKFADGDACSSNTFRLLG